MRIVSGNLTILPESTATDLLTATNAKNTLDRLKNNLTPANTQATQVAALKSLIAIVAELKTAPDLNQVITSSNLATSVASSDGDAIIKGIIKIRKDVTISGKSQLAQKINEIINRVGNE